MDKGYYIVGCMWLACNPNGKSQSTIKMDKGYYTTVNNESTYSVITVAIHNKNGQGLLPNKEEVTKKISLGVAIHNKNGQGLLPFCLGYVR